MSDQIKVQKNVSKTESGVLAKLWGKILSETGMDNSLELLVNRYVNKSNSIKVGKRKTKSSLIKNITATGMSWKTFLDLLFDFIGVLKVDVSVKLYYRTGDTSVHTVTVENLATVSELDKDKEDNNEKV